MPRKQPITEAELTAFAERLDAIASEAGDIADRLFVHLDAEIGDGLAHLGAVLRAQATLADLALKLRAKVENERYAAELKARLTKELSGAK